MPRKIYGGYSPPEQTHSFIPGHRHKTLRHSHDTYLKLFTQHVSISEPEKEIVSRTMEKCNLYTVLFPISFCSFSIKPRKGMSIVFMRKENENQKWKKSTKTKISLIGITSSSSKDSTRFHTVECTRGI